LRNDAAVDGLVEACRKRIATVNGNLNVPGASEGLVLNVGALQRGKSALSDFESSAEEQNYLPQHPKVLVAEDEPGVLLLLTRTLRSENFDLITASDGEAALHLARVELPDLVLLDWHMPRLDGLAVSRTLRAEPNPKLRDVPIVLVTAHASAEDMHQVFAAGVTDYLAKPSTPAHLRTRARAWLLRGSAPSTA
jgi:CheY-like chemotaxis protein